MNHLGMKLEYRPNISYMIKVANHAASKESVRFESATCILNQSHELRNFVTIRIVQYFEWFEYFTFSRWTFDLIPS